MKIALYPGSFNPWHKGHLDIVSKARSIFDRIIICRMVNHAKSVWDPKSMREFASLPEQFPKDSIQCETRGGLLVDVVKELGCHAVIRGLRNGHDLQYEMNLQYWNEDLGLKVPVVYFVTDRALSHISSSAIREVGKFLK